MLGLQRGKVTISTHNSQWMNEAENVIQKLRSLLEIDAVDIQHVGSTSIPNIHAKPIIDIAVAVESFDNLERICALLEPEGIFYVCEDVPGQHLFACGTSIIRTHHIHFVLYGSDEWHNYINFRDYLIAYPDRARIYDKRKQELAELYPCDRTSYTAGKAQLVSKLLKEAKNWRKLSDNS